jgi:hypothetical protein
LYRLRMAHQSPRMNVKSTVQMECKATRHVQQNEVGELYFPARTPIARVLSIIIYYSSLTWPSLGTFGGLGGRPSAQSDLTRAGISRCTGGLLGEFYWAQSWQFDFQTDTRGFTPGTEVPPWSRLSSPYKWNQQVLRVEQLQCHVGSEMWVKTGHT